MGKSRPLERVQFANQIQGFRILNCWEAGEKIQTNIWVSVIFPHTWLFWRDHGQAPTAVWKVTLHFVH